jgi:hypothetical protein
MGGRPWTEREINYLENNWGKLPADKIAKKLHRTKDAVILKVKRFEIPPASMNANCLCVSQIAKLLNVDRHTVADSWISKYNLKSYKIRIRGNNRYQIFVKIPDLLNWLEANQDKWRAHKLPKHAFGLEPEWLKEKRRLDFNKKPLQVKWTDAEVSKLKTFMVNGVPQKEIARRLDRSLSSVKHKINRLKNTPQATANSLESKQNNNIDSITLSITNVKEG